MVLFVPSCQPFPDFHDLLIARLGKLVACHPGSIGGFFERFRHGDGGGSTLSLNNRSRCLRVLARSHVRHRNSNRAWHSGNYSRNLPAIVIGLLVDVLGECLLTGKQCGRKANAGQDMPTISKGYRQIHFLEIALETENPHQGVFRRRLSHKNVMRRGSAGLYLDNRLVPEAGSRHCIPNLGTRISRKVCSIHSLELRALMVG